MALTEEMNVLNNKKLFTSNEFALDERILKALKRLKYEYVSLVQLHCIPLALEGKDLLVKARTGSGKTAAYGIPLIQKILSKNIKIDNFQAIILAPTKELVAQIHQDLNNLIYYCNNIIKITSLGNESMNIQQSMLRDKSTILISTPGKIVSHLKAKNIQLKDTIHTFIIDEADLILSFGYTNDIYTIFKSLPSIFQTFFMSATLSTELNQLKRSFLHNPAIIKLEDGDIDNKLKQFYITIKEEEKDLLLYSLLNLGIIKGKIIFFVNSIDSAYRLKLFFEQFIIKAAVLNSELPYNSRLHIIKEFNKGLFDYLIATDEGIEKDNEETIDSNDTNDLNNNNNNNNNEIDNCTDNENENESENDNDNENDSDNDSNSDNDYDNDTTDLNINNNNNDSNTKDNDSNIKEIVEIEPETTRFSNKNETKKNKFKNKNKIDSSYGVYRGIDFRDVSFVVNVDFPENVNSYIHRIGRTARNGSNGCAISLIKENDTNELNILNEIQIGQNPVDTKKLQTNHTMIDDLEAKTLNNINNKELLKQPALLDFNIKDIDCFRYRVEDVRRAVTKVAIKEAKISDIKKEILNSDKLQSHFEDNPKDLNILQHDKFIGRSKIQPHLAIIPDYLIPLNIQKTINNNISNNNKNKKSKKRNNNNNYNINNKKNKIKTDPLHNFEYNDMNNNTNNTNNNDTNDDNENNTNTNTNKKIINNNNNTNNNDNDRIMYGKSNEVDISCLSGRTKWKAKRKKGIFNPKTIAKKNKKNNKGFSH